jgi:pyruvate/2-oxoglutarate dehydrogenase complex dihydrolipoamide dehydrogenase (E3) component
MVADMLLYVMGRLANTDSLNLAAAGLKVDSLGLLKVNEYYQTEVAHIYAAGDVIGFPFHRFLKRSMALEGLFGSADEIALDVGRQLLAARLVPTLIEL